jgi:hypothetical protein
MSSRTQQIVAQCKAWMILAETRLQNSIMSHESNPKMQSQILELYCNIGKTISQIFLSDFTMLLIR